MEFVGLLYLERLMLARSWGTYSPPLQRRIRPGPPIKPATAAGCSLCASLWDSVAQLYTCECVIYLWLLLLVCTKNCFALFGSLVMAAEDLLWASQMRRMVKATALR